MTIKATREVIADDICNEWDDFWISSRDESKYDIRVGRDTLTGELYGWINYNSNIYKERSLPPKIIAALVLLAYKTIGKPFGRE